MIGEKWLAKVIFTTVQSKADISRVKNGANGDFKSNELSRAINTNETNEITVRAWLARARDRKSTIVFCVDLAHLSDLTKTFREHGIDARFVTGDTPKTVRAERLDAFRNLEYPLLLNCGVFTEGTDIPNIDCVLLARPTKSRNLLVQMIGRGMRLNPGKKDCHVIDMVASLETGIVTTPTLFGLDPSELVKEVDVEQMKEMRERKELESRREDTLASISPSKSGHPSSSDRAITFTDYDSVYDLIDDTSGERHIRGISQLAWVQVEHDRYILSSQSGDYLTIEKTNAEYKSTDDGPEGSGQDTPLYHVRLTAKVPVQPQTIKSSKPFNDDPTPASKREDKSSNAGFSGQAKSWRPYARPRLIATSQSLTAAIHSADTFASSHFPQISISATQAWRRSPATEGQLTFLNKIRDMNAQLTPDMITKGKAADMITKIKFGAKGRFKGIEAKKRQTSKRREQIEKIQTRKRNEEVRVGPLAN